MNSKNPPQTTGNPSCESPKSQEMKEIPLCMASKRRLRGRARSAGVVPPVKEFTNNGAVHRSTNSYMKLPYNPELKERAKALRKSGNLSEALLWQQLKNKQINGLDFDRQKIIGNYIVDFYCSNCGVIIEIDGISHDEKIEYDQQRDAYLSGLGLIMIHIYDLEVKKNLNSVVEMLKNHPALKREVFIRPEL